MWASLRPHPFTVCKTFKAVCQPPKTGNGSLLHAVYTTTGSRKYHRAAGSPFDRGTTLWTPSSSILSRIGRGCFRPLDVGRGLRLIQTSTPTRSQIKDSEQERPIRSSITQQRQNEQPSTSASDSVAQQAGKSGSKEVSEKLVSIPNALTLSRIIAVPFLGHLILVDQLPTALVLLFVAGCTDLLDGWLARRWNSYTVFGSIADPAADKLLMTVMVATLGWKGLMPASLSALILLRDVALVLLAFRIRYISLPPPMTWSRYFNPRLPSAQVQPTQLSKYNTFLQLLSVGGALLVAALRHEDLAQVVDAVVSPSSPVSSATADSTGAASTTTATATTSETTQTKPSHSAAKWADYLEWPLYGLWIATALTTFGSGWGYFVGGAGYKNLRRSPTTTGKDVAQKVKRSLEAMKRKTGN